MARDHTISILHKPQSIKDNNLGEFVPQQSLDNRWMKGQIVGKGQNLSES